MKNNLLVLFSFGAILLLTIPSSSCEGSNDTLSYAPSWINKNDEFLAAIIKEGFLSVGEEYVVYEKKANYFSNMPYSNILAVIVPPDAELISHHNYSRWNTEDLILIDQYVDLALLPGLPINNTKVNPNMCGFFVVSSLLDVDPAYFIVDSWYTFPWIQEHILDSENGITRDEMIPIFEYYGWSVIHPENIFLDIECNENFARGNEFDFVGGDYLCNFKEMLSNDFSPIMTVDLSKRYGVLVGEQYFSEQPVGISEHWVVVLQIITSNDGFSYVRVFNPFNNREEIYTWNDFFYSWTGVEQNYKDMFYVRPNYSKEY